MYNYFLFEKRRQRTFDECNFILYIFINLFKSLSIYIKIKKLFIQNWRRVNVAFTRAKKKLIFVGSINQLSQFEKLKDFLALISAKNWVKNILFFN